MCVRGRGKGRERETERKKQGDRHSPLSEVLGPRRAVPSCDPVAQPQEDLTVPCLPQVFEFFSDILKYFPGTHRQVYRNLQEVKDFIGLSVEKHRETLDPSTPRDFIDAYLIRMDKVGFGEGMGGKERKKKVVGQ